MSVDYSILIDTDASVSEVKSGLEKITNTQFKLRDDWKDYDLYYTEVMGLCIQFNNCDTSASQANKEIFPDIESMYPQYTFEIDVDHLAELIDSGDGKQWVRYAIVELARMINRNMKCNCLIVADDVIINRFTTE